MRAYPVEWHSRGRLAPAAASNSTKTTAAQTPRTPQICRENISEQKRCNPQWHMTSDRSPPASATSQQNGSSHYLLAFYAVPYSVLPVRRSFEIVFVARNESEQNERKRAQSDDKPNQSIFELCGHLKDRRPLRPELRFIVEGEDQRDENKRDVGERQPKTRALRRAAEFEQQSSQMFLDVSHDSNKQEGC